MLDQLCDLDSCLYAWAAPAFSRRGAPAREVIRGLRALLLLFVKNIRSERALVHQELKHNLLYRWFVRLQQGETLSDAFRIRLVRLRQRLAQRLGEEAWQAFLSQSLALARRHYPPQPAAALPGSRTLDLGRVVFDLTSVKARARVLRPRDNPGQRQRRPLSAGDRDAYWIVKERPHGSEATLGYEVGFFSQAQVGLISGVVVRAAGQDNKLQFNDWVDTYQQVWQVPEGQLEVSADREFWTGPILRHGEAHHQTLWIPALDQKPPRGKLDQRYFTYFPAEDLWVCHEGAELPRIGYDAQKKRTSYRASRSACLGCPTASLCRSGKGPRKVTRSDFAPEFERARQRQPTAAFQAARRARSVFAEGSFAHSNGLHGLDRARYVGYGQMKLQAYWTAVAMNWKKACRWAQSRRAA